MIPDYDIYAGSRGVQRMESSPIRMILDRGAALRAAGHHVIPFSAGEPDFNTPETIKLATCRAIENNYTHYGSNRGTPALREILARRIARETGVSYDPATEIFITSSGAEAINNVLLSFIDEGDEVIVFTPAFVSYKNLVKYAGGVFVEIALRSEKGFQPDPVEVERRISPRTKMIVLNNPNNPTGAVYSYETLKALAELAVQHNLLVVSDEMYSALVYEGASFTSAAALPGMKERSLIISGFSKTYAMTGWRLGYVAADRRLGECFLKMHQYSTTCSPTFIQQGLIDSLELPETEIAVCRMIDAFAVRRRMMLDGLSALDRLTYVTPYGAFYVMVDVSATGLTGTEFAQQLLDKQFVATVPAVGLGDACGNFIRISYAASEDNIAEGLRRMEAFLKIL